jgi:excinuclease UvrABC ATPase subunit
MLDGADHLIDIGPEAGGAGGRVVPEAVAIVTGSRTAPFLAGLLTDG